MKESQAQALLDKNTETSVPPEGASGDKAFLTVSGREKNVRNSTGVVLVLFALAGVGLFFMAKKSQPKAATASTPSVDEQTKIETAIARLTGVRAQMLSQMDRVVQKFYEFSDVMQIDVDDLQKNPFQLEVAYSANAVDSEALHLTDKAIQDLRNQFQKEAKALSLSSIITSDENRRCRINEKQLLEGQSIGNFQVIRIDDTEVSLRWEPQDKDISVLTPEERVMTLTLR